MSKKILIVGGVAGGLSAATRLRRNSESDEITVFERGRDVSFSNCSLPYRLGNIIKNTEDLIFSGPEYFKKIFNIDVKIRHEVLSIDRENKQISVKNLLNNEIYQKAYDVLILSPGAHPIIPNIKIDDSMPIFTIRNVEDIEQILDGVKNAKDITVIGGGFIGVEAAENLNHAGKNVSLIEATSQILRPYDEDMVQILHKNIEDKGINLFLNSPVKEIKSDEVLLGNDEIIKAQAVIMAIGVSPENSLAKSANLELGVRSTIKTDEFYKTNDPNIYAIGDAIEVESKLDGQKINLTLAGPALKQAHIVADLINGKKPKEIKNTYIGSSAIKVFDYNAAATGLSESAIEKQALPIKYDSINLVLSDKVSIMPDASYMIFKLIFEVPSGKVLGAQAIGTGDVTKRIDVISTAIHFGGTVYDLQNIEVAYAPPFATAKDIINYAGYAAANVLEGKYEHEKCKNIRTLVDQGAVIIDVREKFEFANGHLKNAINIPLSEIRERLDEIPKDKPVYLYCRSAQRSYTATMILKNRGYENVKNINGGFLFIELYEYYNEKILKKDSIIEG
ncbi:MAG: FAD-dependent oxidoreductase [Clostridia bacterium]|nr:FAD-dependent oxidoreductase [Clostridia bacterium]